MSYILNALRKSEQQRQNNQPETLENRIVEQPPADKKNSGWLIILVIINIIFLSSFIWFFTKQKKPENIEQLMTTQEKPKKQALTTPIIKKKQQADHSNVSIVEQLNKNKSPTPQPVLDLTKTDLEKPVAVTKEKVVQALPALTFADKKHYSRPNLQKSEPPFLTELDSEFRRKVPDLAINVFVFSEKKENRFIMINMEKFLIGQELKNGLLLKDIKMNSIVVEYRNKIFQIKRN